MAYAIGGLSSDSISVICLSSDCLGASLSGIKMKKILLIILVWGLYSEGALLGSDSWFDFQIGFSIKF
jgi:hypothetical protein